MWPNFSQAQCDIPLVSRGLRGDRSTSSFPSPARIPMSRLIFFRHVERSSWSCGVPISIFITMSYRYHHMYIHNRQYIILYIYIYVLWGGIYHTYINNTYDGQHLWLPADHLFSPIPMWPKQLWCFLCAHPPSCLGVCDDLFNYQKWWFSIAIFHS